MKKRYDMGYVLIQIKQGSVGFKYTGDSRIKLIHFYYKPVLARLELERALASTWKKLYRRGWRVRKANLVLEVRP
jgi:hypothetical protein